MFGLDFDWYPHIPWHLPDADYNCSGRTMEEWYSRGFTGYVNGFISLPYGIIAFCIYTVTLIAMNDRSLMAQSCYRLMMVNGILDLIMIFITSIMTGYLSLAGAVYCTHPHISGIIGTAIMGTWLSTCCTVIALALNRVCEMTGYMKWLFSERICNIWIATSLLLGLYFGIFTHPVIYSSSTEAWLYTPLISDDFDMEVEVYSNHLHPLINYSTTIILVSAYVFLFFYIIVKVNQSGMEGSVGNKQLKVFFHCLLVCGSTAATSSLYIYIQYVRNDVIIEMAIVTLQLSCFTPCLAGLLFNSQIRGRSLHLLGLGSKDHHVSAGTVRPSTTDHSMTL